MAEAANQIGNASCTRWSPAPFTEHCYAHEDDEDPGVVPIIGPLRLLLDTIKPENASGWMFPNTIGGRLTWTTSLTA